MKTMRYILVFLLSLVFCFGLVAAEKPVKEKKPKKPLPEFPFKRFYVDAYVGYSFPLASLELQYTENYTFGFPPRCSMGEGLRAGINFAYNFNKYLSVELGGMCVAYLHTDGGVLWKPVYVFDTVEQDGESYIVSRDIASLHDRREVESHMGQFSIQLVASPGFARWNPYVKAGLGFVAGKLEARQRYDMSRAETFEELYCREYAFKESYFHLGFVGAVGLNCHLSKTISLFFEWQFSVHGLWGIYWGNGILQSESGDAALVSALGLRKDRLVDGDHVSFSSHGLNIGVKFKF